MNSTCTTNCKCNLYMFMYVCVCMYIVTNISDNRKLGVYAKDSSFRKYFHWEIYYPVMEINAVHNDIKN